MGVARTAGTTLTSVRLQNPPLGTRVCASNAVKIAQARSRYL
jgi:hypothetical protein